MSAFLWLVYLIASGCSAKDDKEDVMLERKIHKNILAGYDTDIRPEIAHGEPLHIHFDNRLQKIVKLDVKQQVFIANSFAMMRWHDPQLEWNSTKYEEIEMINLGIQHIWTPDIVLYNTAHEESFSHHDLYKTKALVSHKGNVVWTAPVTWRVSCSFDVTWFPVDKQVCNLTFGSWSYTSKQLTISPWKENITIEDFKDQQFGVETGEWVIDDLRFWVHELNYSCCPDPFSTITYEIHMKRMSLYYFLYIILPLLSQVFLFLMVFHIPPDTGERMGFGVTILLSITVYLLVISEKLPEKSDDHPMLGICFIAEFYVLSTALVMALWTINLGRYQTKPPCILQRLVCSDTCDHENINRETEALPMIAVEDKGATQADQTDQSENRQTKSIQRQHNHEWKLIASRLDKIFFYFFVFIVVIIPMIVVGALNKSHLGI